MRKGIFVILALLSFGLTTASAQELPVGPPSVKVDGLISDEEYALSIPLDNITVHAARTADTLYFGISAQTRGWVALGFGSERMDGASLFIGTVTRGAASLSSQLGRAHSHNEIGANPVTDFAMSEEADRTTMELAFKAADLITAGQTDLTILAAFGPNDRLNSYHVSRGRLTIQLN